MCIEHEGAPRGSRGGHGREAVPEAGDKLLLAVYREEREFLLRIIRNETYCLPGMEEDLLHGAVERLLSREARGGKGWESKAHCRNSILRTARNLAIDYRRREACRTRVFLYESEMRGGGSLPEEDGEAVPNYEGLASGADPDENPEELCLREEERGIVVEFLGSLSECDRRLLVLREVMDVPWSEIARELGVGQENLRVRYSRLKARLRGALEAAVRS